MCSTWDPDRSYWATTRQYVEQFLADVAADSGSFDSPFAVTPEYTMANGTVHADNVSVFAGGCVDYGSSPGNNSGYTCQFGANHPSGTGNDYPTTGNCPPTGNNAWGPTPNGPLNSGASNSVCLTDAQIKTELQSMLPQMGLPGGNAVKDQIQLQPLVDVLLPAGVEVCLDSVGHVCSSNSDAASPQAQFCSYHSQVDINGTEVTYVVQPWTAQWGQGVGCDDPAAPNISLPVNQLTLAQQVAQKLVSPLSQANIAAIVNPGLDGWYGYNAAIGENGTEINDNGCGPLTGTLDNVTINGNTYALQREFNNAGAIETDPDALPCTGTVLLNPTFIVPGPVEPGDNVLFDGSVTASTLMVHNGAYQWNFGDGTSGTGPSVYHAYSKPGNYQVTLKVTDRGGNTASITQTVQVLGSNGQPAAPPTSIPGSGASGDRAQRPPSAAAAEPEGGAGARNGRAGQLEQGSERHRDGVDHPRRSQARTHQRRSRRHGAHRYRDRGLDHERHGHPAPAPVAVCGQEALQGAAREHDPPPLARLFGQPERSGRRRCQLLRLPLHLWASRAALRAAPGAV